MPKQKDLKRTVRSRMRKTGESYTAARAQLQKRKTAEPTPDYAALGGMSDEAVQKKTGKTWKGWVRALDAVDANTMPHKEIARHLHDEEALPAWWAQTVTIGYERIRGLRQKGQSCEGDFRANKSKTYPVSIDRLYQAFQARYRRKWLGDAELTVKKATPKKSMRVKWGDGTSVDLNFWAKGKAKSQVQLQHRQVASKARADELKAFWTERLAALGDHLRG